MHTAEYWVNHLNLLAHPEGGFYKETYRSREKTNGFPDRFSGERNFSTAIYFLLRSQDRSLFHRIKSDELWHFHDGSALTIYVLDRNGLTQKKLGSNPEKGESLQVVIPANCWFGAKVNTPDNFTLSGCTVAPGFDFQDFELAKRSELLKEFPEEKGIILTLTT
jgi:uncharacterized protein